MWSGPARGWWLALLLGVAWAGCPAGTSATPAEAPPEGFVWEDLKELHASVPRPEKWQFRRTLPACPFFDFSPVPFTGPVGVDKGVAIHLLVRMDQPADERAAAWVAECAAKSQVLRGWTRKSISGEPFTRYGLVFVLPVEETEGVKCIAEVALVANRVTNAVYQCWVVAPAAEWKDVEATGEEMLADLRLDPEF